MNDSWKNILPGARARFFELGEVRLAVLSLLHENPAHGYQLMKELAARLGKLYQSSAGTVYPALQQLEKERLIEHRLEQRRKVYRLTPAGRKALGAESGAVRALWSRAEEIEDLGQQLGPHSMTVAGPLSELFTATLRAARLSGGDPNREDQIRGIVRRASAELNRLTEKKREHR